MSSNIVDKEGLSKVLLISPHLIEKTWRQYPHFFVGQKKTGRCVRFDVNDVIEFLKNRDYNGNARQENKNVDWPRQAEWLSKPNKKRLSDKKGSNRLGAKNNRSSEKSRSATEEFARFFGISEVY